MIITRRDFAVGLVVMTATLAAVAGVGAASPLIGESVYDWNKLTVVKTPVGESRAVVKGPTATLDELEMHVTTLNPGLASHPPHKHPNEELVLLDTGTVEALVNGEWKRLGPGSIIFNASNVTHALRNVGNTPAQYHVINWRTDKTPKE
ncbi:cupin domain-containing protein [Granulicella sp. dw_53]|uniref:cupin domain-containing protein n=1 Tax=Granulicella sp. dw_53 TaxID=2719792 RepID=UPI001BD65287|nr:cupin domain-containing protein [Granulicella sp. dw_53]